MAYELNAADASEILPPGQIVTLDPCEFLFREDDPGDALYIVKKGLVRIVSGQHRV
jgi:CRP-like cAMP-binding protein